MLQIPKCSYTDCERADQGLGDESLHLLAANVHAGAERDLDIEERG